MKESQKVEPYVLIADMTQQKNVYSVFRVQPPSIGFAQLSDLALAGAPDLDSGSKQNSPGGPTKGNGKINIFTCIINSATLRLLSRRR